MRGAVWSRRRILWYCKGRRKGGKEERRTQSTRERERKRRETRCGLLFAKVENVKAILYYIDYFILKCLLYAIKEIRNVPASKDCDVVAVDGGRVGFSFGPPFQTQLLRFYNGSAALDLS